MAARRTAVRKRGLSMQKFAVCVLSLCVSVALPCRVCAYARVSRPCCACVYVGTERAKCICKTGQQEE